jgi:hypothetical protein
MVKNCYNERCDGEKVEKNEVNYLKKFIHENSILKRIFS